MSQREPDQYDLVRRPEHSTLGDSRERHERDADAFTAGVQHALDRMVHDTAGWVGLNDYVVRTAAAILSNVQNGRL